MMMKIDPVTTCMKSYILLLLASVADGFALWKEGVHVCWVKLKRLAAVLFAFGVPPATDLLLRVGCIINTKEVLVVCIYMWFNISEHTRI